MCEYKCKNNVTGYSLQFTIYIQEQSNNKKKVLPHNKRSEVIKRDISLENTKGNLKLNYVWVMSISSSYHSVKIYENVYELY